MTYRHSPALVVVLYGLVVALPLFTLALGHFAIEHWVIGERGLSLALAATALAGLAATLVALRWEPFIGVRVTLGPSGLSVTTRQGTREFAWHSLGGRKDNPVLQLMRIYNTEGELILAVDYLLVNYREFKQQLDAYWPVTPKSVSSS